MSASEGGSDGSLREVRWVPTGQSWSGCLSTIPELGGVVHVDVIDHGQAGEAGCQHRLVGPSMESVHQVAVEDRVRRGVEEVYPGPLLVDGAVVTEALAFLNWTLGGKCTLACARKISSTVARSFSVMAI